MTLAFEKVAIVGATGATGRALADELMQRNVPTRVVSRSMEHLAESFPQTEIEKRAGDALDGDSLRAAVEGCDLIVDCIGLPGDKMALHPETARNIVMAAGQTGARCLQVSSYWCYMPIGDLAVSENHPRTGGPDWAKWRRETEDILRDAGGAILHLPDFFGPHVAFSALQMARRDAVAGKKIQWLGDANAARDYIYVPDAMRIAADLMTHEQAYGQDWIVPGSGPISATEAAEIMAGVLGMPVKVGSTPIWLLWIVSLFNKDLRSFMQVALDYVKPISFDGAKLASLLGAVPRASYEDAFRQTVESLGHG